MKKTTTYALVLVAGTACVIVDWRFNYSAWMGLIGIVVGLYGLHRLLIAWESSQNLRAIRSAFANLDLIYAGLHFVGAESELIDWRRVDHPRDDGPIQIAQLGRTKKGQWFELNFELRFGRTGAYSVRLLDEGQARTWLSYDVKAYERVFSRAEIA